jgi:hypothetical protein
MINDQLAILNKKIERDFFIGRDEWIESGGSRLAEGGILLSFTAN